jgi:hypothetical protein
MKMEQIRRRSSANVSYWPKATLPPDDNDEIYCCYNLAPAAQNFIPHRHLIQNYSPALQIYVVFMMPALGQKPAIGP